MSSIIPDWLLNLLFPPYCLICGKRGSYLCQECREKLTVVNYQICPVCGRPALLGKTHPRCQSRYSLDGLFSVFSYRSSFSLAVKKAKYQPFLFAAIRELVSPILPYLKKEKDFAFLREVLEKERPLLVPIPLSYARFRWRGYNQTRIIAMILGEEWQLPLADDLLIRIKKTGSQSLLSRKERQRNLKEAFAINYQSAVFRGDRNALPPILLVDDIWTTGATMRTAANVLKRAGFPLVWGLTLCR